MSKFTVFVGGLGIFALLSGLPLAHHAPASSLAHPVVPRTALRLVKDLRDGYPLGIRSTPILGGTTVRMREP